MKKNQKLLNIALFGFGKFGKNWARVLQETNGVKLDAVVVLSEASVNDARRILPESILITQNANEVLNSAYIDAVTIATPPSTHFELCKKALRAKKHVLCEKPMVLSSIEATILEKEVAHNSITFMVGYQYCFNDNILFIKQLIDKGVLGTIKKFVARHNLSPRRSDVSCFWDAAPHAFSIVKQLFNPGAVLSALGIHSYDTTQAMIRFQNGLLLDLETSYHGKEKIRFFQMFGEKGSIILDETKKTNKLTFDGIVATPSTNIREPLHKELEHFISCIQNKKEPLTNVRFGTHITQYLEIVDKKLKKVPRALGT